MTIARHAQVQRISNVTTELEGVEAGGLCPVVDKLNLVLALDQWAIAAADVEALAELTDSRSLGDVA